MNIIWHEYKLGDISTFKNGVNFSASSMGTGISLINVKDITNPGFLVSKKLDKVSVSVKDDYYAREDDIFFVRSSVKREGIADVNLFKELSVPAIHCGFIIRCRLDNKYAFTLFCYYYFKNPNFREYIRGFSSGTAIINISQGSLKYIKIYLPPLPTQKKIAKILSNYDDLIENNLKRIKLLEESARLTYEEWFLRFRIDGVKLDIDSETGFPYGWGIEKFKTQLNFKTGKLDSNAVVPDGIYDFYTCAKEIFKTNTTCFNGEAVLLGGNNATGDFSLFYANSKFDAYQRTYIVTSDNLPLVYVFFVLKNYLPYFKNISSGAATK
ncbi:restriction endonuclease subunit S, partial [Candidatus Venteria ishoeyi]